MEVSLRRLYQSLATAEREVRRLRGAYTNLRAASREVMQSCEARPQLPRLTFQERRVALLAASGKSNREIGTALHVSLHTVKSQMKSILRKLELRSRTQIVFVMTLGGNPRAADPLYRSASDWVEPDAALVSR